MKKMNTVLSIAMMALVASGCSVQQREVVNQPPVMPKSVSKEAQKPGEQGSPEFGPVTLYSVTLFYWPEVQDEAQAQTLVRTVNTASEEVDKLTTQLQEIQRKLATLETEFSKEKCVHNWADLDPEEDPDFVEWVAKWKAAPVENDPEFAVKSVAREKCIKNQDQRKTLPKEADKILSEKLPVQIGTVYKSIDPGYPEKVENMKSVSAKDSTLIIPVSGEPVITLADFVHPGNKQSTVIEGPGQILQPVYFKETKLLMFNAPELGADGAPTGAILMFALERAPDFNLLARFSGKVRLVKDGQVLRYGRAKFEGCMTDVCKKTYGLDKRK